MSDLIKPIEEKPIEPEPTKEAIVAKYIAAADAQKISLDSKTLPAVELTAKEQAWAKRFNKLVPKALLDEFTKRKMASQKQAVIDSYLVIFNSVKAALPTETKANIQKFVLQTIQDYINLEVTK